MNLIVIILVCKRGKVMFGIEEEQLSFSFTYTQHGRGQCIITHRLILLPREIDIS